MTKFILVKYDRTALLKGLNLSIENKIFSLKLIGLSIVWLLVGRSLLYMNFSLDIIHYPIGLHNSTIIPLISRR